LSIRFQPLRSDLTIQILIAHGGLFQTDSQRLGALPGDEMLHRLIDEPAALPASGDPVNGSQGGLR
jgi:hypothetical protein